MADLAQLIGSLPPDQREALKRQLVGKFQTAEPPSWKPPQWVPEMAVGMLPGAGDAMSAMDSVSAGQRMADAWRAGDYGGAAGAGLEALGHGLGVLPFFPSMVKAYHGSPHRFDAFDMSKIGTGEGAQAYGHGLYFAEDPKIAGHYRKKLAPNLFTFKVNDKSMDWDEFRQFVADEVQRRGGNRDMAYQWAGSVNYSMTQHPQTRGDFNKSIESFRAPGEQSLFSFAEKMPNEFPGGPERAKDFLATRKVFVDVMDELNPTPGSRKGGAIYNVALDVEPEDLLDWDAPLSQQSKKVQGALVKMGYDENALAGQTGSELYRSLTSQFGGDAAASRALAEAGIPGLRYFDAGSRGGGEGTRNVVMFRDDLIKIEGVE